MDSFKLHRNYTTDRISYYRTQHTVEYYFEVFSIEGFKEAVDFASQKGRPIFILGNGSNLIFRNPTVRSVLIRNRMPATITPHAELPDTFDLTATLSVTKALRHCLKEERDSFYYLASVPATIGGALAMNAGRGRQNGSNIYDFVDKVTYFDPAADASEAVKTINTEDAVTGYRNTIFTGIQNKLILSGQFCFKKTTIQGDPIKERMQWSKANQDYTGPNCGTVFMHCRGKIMPFLKGFGDEETHYSKNCSNWIINRSKDPAKLLRLISITKFLSLIALKPAKLENIIID